MQNFAKFDIYFIPCSFINFPISPTWYSASISRIFSLFMFCVFESNYDFIEIFKFYSRFYDFSLFSLQVHCQNFVVLPEFLTSFWEFGSMLKLMEDFLSRILEPWSFTYSRVKLKFSNDRCNFEILKIVKLWANSFAFI